MFTIIDRYIAKEFIKFFFAALITFATLYLVVEMMSNITRIQADSGTLWRYYLFELPTIIYRMTPVSCLMATIFTVSTLSRNSELVALFSAGLSLARISVPIISLAVLISVASFVISDRLIPPSQRMRNYIRYVEIEKKPNLYYTVKTNKIWYRSKDLIYNIKTFDPKNQSVYGLTIYYFDPEWRLSQVTTAESASYDGDKWTLHDGLVTLFSEQGDFPLTQKFKNKVITLDESPADIEEMNNDQDIMSVRDLRRYIRKNREAGLDTTRFEVTYHEKFAFAFVSVVMVFLGIPFSVSRERSGGFALNIGLCLGLVFAYWILVSIGLSLGNHNTIPPLMAAWAPNAMMLGVAVYFLLRLKR